MDGKNIVESKAKIIKPIRKMVNDSAEEMEMWLAA